MNQNNEVNDQQKGLTDHSYVEKELVIPVIQEDIVVGKKLVETGSVRISKQVFEEEFTQNATLASEEVIVERKEINQYIDQAPPAVRQEGNVTIISVVKEVLVVEKRLMLVEELHLTKHKTSDSTTINEVLRKEEVSVTRTSAGTDF